MWVESKKWKELIKSGGHSVVRFDVYCCQCKKQIGEDVPVKDLFYRAQGRFMVERPMEVACSMECIVKFKGW